MGKLLTGLVVSPTLVTLQMRMLGSFHKKKIIFANGCFDILHPGHISMLKKAKKLGGYLIVAVNSDESTRRVKGGSRPIHCLEDRMSVLSELRCVDFVTWFDEDTPLELILKIKPDYIVKGDDYVFSEVVGFSEAKSWGGEVVILPRHNNLSTTRILNYTACGK